MPNPIDKTLPDPEQEKIQLIFYLDHVDQRTTSAITFITVKAFGGDPDGDPDTLIFLTSSGSSGSPAPKTKPPANS